MVAERFRTGDIEFQTAADIMLNLKVLDWKLFLVAG